MPLLNTRHSNPETAALSIAANRASKVQLLRAEGNVPCDRLAAKYELSLYRDVLEFIAQGRTSDAARLADVALTAWPEWKS